LNAQEPLTTILGYCRFFNPCYPVIYRISILENIMPPIDLKVLVKQVITDPAGLNMPTPPGSAIVVGKATGDKGNRTGVYGYSERSIGIYGEGPVFAGFFDGDVYIGGKLESADTVISGNLTVTGADITLHGHSIHQLVQKVGEIEQQGEDVQQLAQRVSALEQRIAVLEKQNVKSLEQRIIALESQIKTADSNLNGRVSQAEIAISDLRAKVNQIIAELQG
jgi:hypothetical protein